jgi:predicted site-specific integrase-resolvase
MKKLFITGATLVLLSTASFADQNTENQNKMDAMRKQFFMMTDQMMNDQMSMLKMQESMLTNYQKLLKQMMENDSGAH